MTTTRRSHADCTHPSTPAARAACRKGQHEAGLNSKVLATEAQLDEMAAWLDKPAAVDYSTMTYRFETETCSRCAGTGTYPSSAWNGVCLGCNGNGESLTRAGRAAKKIHDQWMIDNLTVEARTLQPGQKFQPNQVDGWKTVVEIDTEPHYVGKSTIGSGDNAVTTEMWHITIRTQRTSYGMPADSSVIRSATAEERNALLTRIAKLKGTILTAR